MINNIPVFPLKSLHVLTALAILLSTASASLSEVTTYDTMLEETPIATYYYHTRAEMIQALKEEGGFRLVFTQTELTPQKVERRYTNIATAVAKRMPHGIRDINVAILTLKSKRNEPYSADDLGAKGEFCFGGQPVYTFRLAPGPGRMPYSREIAEKIVSVVKTRSLTQQHLKNLENAARCQKEAWRKARNLLPDSIDISVDNNKHPGPIMVTTKERPKLVARIDLAAKPEELTRVCSILKVAQTCLYPDVDVSLTLERGIKVGFLWYVDNTNEILFITDAYFNEPYLRKTLAAIKEAFGDKRPETVVQEIGEGKNSISRSKLLLGILTELKQSDSVTLYSLMPDGDKDKNGFYNWKVLGKRSLDLSESRQVAASLTGAISERSLIPGSCFIPRHGLRIVRDGKRIDLIICFQCKEVLAIAGDRVEYYHITQGAKATLNKVLNSHHVPLAPDAKEEVTTVEMEDDVTSTVLGDMNDGDQM